MSALDANNRAFLTALAEAGYPSAISAQSTFRCGHFRTPENTARMGRSTACRACLAENKRRWRERNHDPEASRAARLPEIIETAEQKLLGLYREAERRGVSVTPRLAERSSC